MSSLQKEAFSLFCECFKTDETEARILLSFAEKHGRIYLKDQEGETANMICSAEISDKDFCADYLFACCTKPKFRNRGFFRKHLSEVIESKGAVLIPESKELFGFYKTLGFSPIYHLEVRTDAFKNAKVCNITSEELFEVYERSDSFPKKRKELFVASFNAFVHYGGSFKEENGIFAATIGKNITEIFSESKEKAISLLKELPQGEQTLLLPKHYEKFLSENNIDYEINSIAMAKNVPPSMMQKIYLNNLFN